MNADYTYNSLDEMQSEKSDCSQDKKRCLSITCERIDQKAQGKNYPMCIKGRACLLYDAAQRESITDREHSFADHVRGCENPKYIWK